MVKYFMAFATEDIKQKTHTWTKGKVYLLTERKGSFTLESNEGKFTYATRLRESALKYFDVSEYFDNSEMGDL